MKTLVISGINLFEGGTLSIFYDCLDSLIEGGWTDSFGITIFVHKRSLFAKYDGIMEIIELPRSRKSYLNRVYYEYVYFRKWSEEHRPDVWISIHDMTPSVRAGKLYTYCHNPMPFFRMTAGEVLRYPRYGLFALFYSGVYRKNIGKADAVIVQQNWIRQEFLRRYRVKSVIVARPSVKPAVPCAGVQTGADRGDRKIFIFYSLPRFFKNFEVICEACRYMEGMNFEVRFTIDGTENSYSRGLRKKYGGIKNIKWLGLQTREDISRLTAESDYLIFPSRLETWGLPITECKAAGKGMILADLPYAHETAGNYDRAVFFDPADPKQLAGIMTKACEGGGVFTECREEPVAPPYAADWQELLEMLLR